MLAPSNQPPPLTTTAGLGVCRSPWLRFTFSSVLMSADLTAMAGGAALAGWLRHALIPVSAPGFDGALHASLAFFTTRGDAFLFLGAAFLIFSYAAGAYDRFVAIPKLIEISLLGVLTIALFDGFIHYALKTHASRIGFAMQWSLTAILVAGFRLTLIHHMRRAARWSLRAALCGDPDILHRLRGQLALDRLSNIDIVDNIVMPAGVGGGGRALDRRIDALPSDCAIIIAFAEDAAGESERLCRRLIAQRRPFFLVPPHCSRIDEKLTVEKRFGCDFLLLRHTPGRRRKPHEWSVPGGKRAFDIAVAAIGLIVLSPLMAAIALLIRREDGGPVFYRQRRVGAQGKIFAIRKFRTMAVDSERRLADLLASDPESKRQWKDHQKLRDDPRITAVGRFLRRVSLDELPQLFNVLIGDMSLVGPRPLIAPDLAGFPNDKAYRHSPEFASYAQLRPGITGAWQVGGRSSLAYKERIRLDAWYGRNLSFTLDIVILFKTIAFLLRRGCAH